MTNNLTSKHMAILLILASMIWGVSGVMTKGLITVIPPVFYMGIRFLLAFCVIFIFQFRSILANFRKKDMLPIFIVSLFMAGGYVFCNVSMLFTTATNAIFFYSVSVVMIPFLAKFINNTDFSKKLLIGMGITLAGMYFLVSDGGEFSLNLGDLLALGSALLFALQVVYTAKYVNEIKPVILSSFQFLFVGILGILGSLFAGETVPFASYGLKEWGSILFLSIFATAIVYVIQTIAQVKLSESTVGLIYTLIPLFTAVLSWIFLGETLTGYGIFGAVVMLAGVGIASVFQKDKGELEEGSAEVESSI